MRVCVCVCVCMCVCVRARRVPYVRPGRRMQVRERGCTRIAAHVNQAGRQAGTHREAEELAGLVRHLEPLVALCYMLKCACTVK